MFDDGESREIISKWLCKSDWILWFMVDIQLYLMGFINQIVPPGKQAIENHNFYWENQLKMAIFNSYVSLPEGNWGAPSWRGFNDSTNKNVDLTRNGAH